MRMISNNFPSNDLIIILHGQYGGINQPLVRTNDLRQKAQKTFLIPETSITPLMARILFGITAFFKPSRILGIGTYAGNSLLWIVGPSIQSEKYLLDYAYGVDRDVEATRLAMENFSKLGTNLKIKLISADGHTVCQKLNKKLESVESDVFNIGTGELTSTQELVNTLKKVSGNSEVALVKPESPCNMPSFLQRTYPFDIGKAKKFLGYKPKFDIKEGLQDYLIILK